MVVLDQRVSELNDGEDVLLRKEVEAFVIKARDA